MGEGYKNTLSQLLYKSEVTKAQFLIVFRSPAHGGGGLVPHVREAYVGIFPTRASPPAPRERLCAPCSGASPNVGIFAFSPYRLLHPTL